VVQYVSTHLPGRIAHHLKRSPQQASRALKAAVSDVVSAMKSSSSVDDMRCGTCLAGFLLQPSRQIHVMHIGDCVAVMYGADGQVLHKTKSHDVHNHQERQRVSGDYFQKLAITRALGDDDMEHKGVCHDPDVDLWSLPASSGKFSLVACTDGVLETDTRKLASLSQLGGNLQGASTSGVCGKIITWSNKQHKSAQSRYKENRDDAAVLVVRPFEP